MYGLKEKQQEMMKLADLVFKKSAYLQCPKWRQRDQRENGYGDPVGRCCSNEEILRMEKGTGFWWLRLGSDIKLPFGT